MRRMLTTVLLLGVLGEAAVAEEVSGWQSRTLDLDGLAVTAEKAVLTVPENRAHADSRNIDLTFVRLVCAAEEPGPPLFFLPGGPGDAAVPMAQSPAWAPFLALGDVVLLDPRGVGESEPDLFYASETINPALFFTDRETAVAHMSDVCREAAEHFAGLGIDLSGYQPNEMADDLEDLRTALDYDTVHVMGHSFGTILGQVWIRRHPGTVARFVSVGTAGTYDIMKLPSQLDRSLHRLAEAVAADAVLEQAVPDLFTDIEDAVAVLEDEPLVVELDGDGGVVEVPVGPFGLQLILLIDLGDTADLPVIPRLVHSVLDREPELLRWFVEKRWRTFARIPVFMLHCRGAAGATAERWARIRDEAVVCPFATTRCLFSPEADAALGVVDLGDAFREPVCSDVPTLFVSGALDAATPPEQAEDVRQGFPVSGHVVVEHGGHEDLMPDPEVQRAIVRFLQGAAPGDLTIPRPPLRFAPLQGPAPDVPHPSLTPGR